MEQDRMNRYGGRTANNRRTSMSRITCEIHNNICAVFEHRIRSLTGLRFKLEADVVDHLAYHNLSALNAHDRRLAGEQLARCLYTDLKPVISLTELTSG